INSKNPKNEKVYIQTETTKPQSTVYTLKEYNGRVALFINDNKLPKETFEIRTNSLPTGDIEKLKIGIRVTSEKDLQKIIEDYTS
ncbi:MAG: BofC C-terminal domain-containing protein, partial [Clostridia bacterium]|nr:BofC C-terminal domain-containing protein [Clostridia bacterium]